MFEEITANLEEPMSDQQRERYCFSLITPFGEYSSTINPKWLIKQTQESIKIKQGRGEDEDIDYLERQIERAKRKAEKYLDLAFKCGLERDKVGSVFFEFAQIVNEYGILLDAAFVVHGLDLKRLQDKCGVWIRHFTIDELRVLDICYYIGSEALAEEYLSRLPQEQPEPQQEQGNGLQEQQPGTQQERQQQPSNSGEVVLPDVLNTPKTRAVFDEAISRGWMQPNGKGGYSWLGLKDADGEELRGKGQQFVYMIGKMYGYKKGYSGNDGNDIPCKAIEKLFEESDIYSKLIKCWEAKKPQHWREAIDTMIAAALQKMTASTSN